jgi:hypothetical protein
MSTGVATMGRPKSSAKPKGSGPSSKPEERGERETVIHMKGSPEYVDWLEAIHKQTRIPKVQIFRLALEEWAAKSGYPVPPEI